MQLAFALQNPNGAGPIADYVRGLAAGLRELGHRVDVVHGADALPHGARAVLDGSLLPALLPERNARLGPDAVALIHHPGTSDDTWAALREWLPRCGRVIATSAPAADRLAAKFGVARGRLAVVPPGVPDAPRSAGSGTTGCAILSVGVLAPGSGHDTLLRAVGGLPDLDWSLTAAGSAGQDPAYAELLAEHARQPGLAGRVRIHADPDPDALEASWRGADLFALAARGEDATDAVAEALRRGLPVATTHGAAGALVPDGAGTTSVVDDAAALSKCLRRMIFDAGLRRAMAEAAWRAGQAMPGWPAQAALFVESIG